jgi:hypothetical protein
MWEAEISGGSQFEVKKRHLNKWLGTGVCTCHSSYVRKHRWEEYGPDQPRHKGDANLKTTNAKRAAEVAQVERQAS